MPHDTAPVPAMTAHRALADVALAAIESADGRVTRWPRATAVRMLAAEGVPASVAVACAEAMVAVGAVVRERLASAAKAQPRHKGTVVNNGFLTAADFLGTDEAPDAGTSPGAAPIGPASSGLPPDTNAPQP